MPTVTPSIVRVMLGVVTFLLVLPTGASVIVSRVGGQHCNGSLVQAPIRSRSARLTGPAEPLHASTDLDEGTGGRWHAGSDACLGFGGTNHHKGCPESTVSTGWEVIQPFPRTPIPFLLRLLLKDVSRRSPHHCSGMLLGVIVSPGL